MRQHATAQRMLDNYQDAGKAAAVTLDAICCQIDVKRLKALQAETRAQRKLSESNALITCLANKQSHLFLIEQSNTAFDTAAHALCCNIKATAQANIVVSILQARCAHFEMHDIAQTRYEQEISDLHKRIEQSEANFSNSQSLVQAYAQGLQKTKLDLDRTCASAAVAEALLVAKEQQELDRRAAAQHVQDTETKKKEAVRLHQIALDANLAALAAREAMSFLAVREVELERDRQQSILAQKHHDAKSKVERELAAHQEVIQNENANIIAETHKKRDALLYECTQLDAAISTAKNQLNEIQATSNMMRSEYEQKKCDLSRECQELVTSKLEVASEL